jgi:hypothetical protein
LKVQIKLQVVGLIDHIVLTAKKRVGCCGIPLKPKYGLTPICCHAC